MSNQVSRDYGRRIVSYIAEVFPDVRECDSSTFLSEEVGESFPVRDFSFGFVLTPEDTVEDACQQLTGEVLEKIQKTFGVQSQPHIFVWREKPGICLYEDLKTGLRKLQFYFRFAIVGWRKDQTLADFLGCEDALVP